MNEIIIAHNNVRKNGCKIQITNPTKKNNKISDADWRDELIDNLFIDYVH